mmetsp:Transcript_3502/g.4809  ORF Transcript_3502/g.4809 Transcript_3502/m.4809 type:complete len:107 (+) Transcript_3502:154-474(+)
MNASSSRRYWGTFTCDSMLCSSSENQSSQNEGHTNAKDNHTTVSNLQVHACMHAYTINQQQVRMLTHWLSRILNVSQHQGDDEGYSARECTDQQRPLSSDAKMDQQ